MFWTGTLFLPDVRSQPSTPNDVSLDALRDTEITCAASCLTDLIGEINLSDEPASDAGTDCPESRLVSLLDQLHVTSEPAADLESVGSTDPMIVESDTVSLDMFPTNVVVYDEPPPCEHNGGSTVMEVLVINIGEHSDGGARDPLYAALRDLSAPIPADADIEALEACRVQLIESASRLASMRRLSEAQRREIDRAVGGMPTLEGPSRAGSIRLRGVAIAGLFGAERPIYAMPAGNIRAAQAVADEMDKYEGDERRHLTERVQQFLDTAAQQHEAGCRDEAPTRQNNEPPPRQDHGATSRTPIGDICRKKANEPAASRSWTHLTIERDAEGRP